MSGGSLALSVVIGAALSASFNRTFQSARQRTDALNHSLSNAEGQRASIARFRSIEQQLGRTSASFQAAQARTACLGRAFAATENPTRQMRQEFERARQQSNRLRDAHQSQRNTLRNLREGLRGAGIDTRRLADEERRLGGEIRRTNQIRQRSQRREQLQTRMGDMRGRVLGALGSAYSVGRLVAHNAKFEHALTMTANSGGINKEQKTSLREQLRQESTTTNQNKNDLLSGVDFLVGKGLSFDQATASIGKIGMAATASGASVLDLSRSAFSMIDNMKMSSNEIGKALDIIASSGKQGGFELKAMATYFPALTAQAQALGLKGKTGIASLGAALQIAVKGAGSESEGANNLQNFLSKITSKETVGNLKKMGVSVQDVFAQAKVEGKNPLIEIIKSIKQVTNGDSFKLNQLFGDMQVKNFLNPMMANMGEFSKIYTTSLSAMNVNQKDFEIVMGDTTEKFQALGIQASNVGDAFAKSLKPAIDWTLESLTTVSSWASNGIKKYPIIGEIIGGLAVVFIGMTSAILAVTAAQWLWNTSVVAGTLNIVRNSAAFVASKALLLGAAVAMGTVTAAQWLWNIALSANPIGAVILGVTAAVALLAGGAFFLYKHWDTVTQWFGKKMDWIAGKIGFVGDLWNGLFGGDKNQSVNINTNTPKKEDQTGQNDAALKATLHDSVKDASKVVHQDNRANYELHVHVADGDPEKVKAAVHQVLQEKEQHHAAQVNGLMFDLQGA